MYDYLIVGSGLFGAIFAHEAMKKGKTCLVLEKRDHIGGNIYTEEVEVFRFTVMVPTFSIQATQKSGITFSSLQNLTVIPIHRLPDIKTNFTTCLSI